MSQFTLTPEEDTLVLATLRNRATQVRAMLGADEALESLIAHLESQLPQPEPVVEEVAEEVEAAVEEVAVEEATPEEVLVEEAAPEVADNVAVEEAPAAE